MTRSILELNQERAMEAPNSFSDRFFNDPSLVAGYNAFRPANTDRAMAGDYLIMTDPYTEGEPTSNSSPMLNDTIKEQIKGADKLTLSTPEQNNANGAQPDYRLVENGDGKLVLEKVGDGDPLSDGELNIELDTKGKSLEESILQGDKTLKEFYRELIAQWVKDHPGKQHPQWWQDIIDSEPAIPTDVQAVPIRQSTQPRVEQPQPQSQPQEQTEPGGGGGNFGRSGSGGGSGGGAGSDSGGGYRGGDGGDRTHSGATPNTDKQTLLENVRTVVDVAKEVGVDPKLAVAMMLVESGGNNQAIGDNGTSFGLFQLHEGGMLTSAGLTPEQAFDPETNARVSLGNLARIDDQYANPGEAAAASQRPADPEGYARKVNESMGQAAELIAQAENAERQQVASGQVSIGDGDWLSPEAAGAFRDAQSEARANGSEIQVSSAGRTFEEQTELWNNRANNPYPVARPGTSNHESGDAIDVSNYSDPVVRNALHNHGFRDDVPGDPVHFDYKA